LFNVKLGETKVTRAELEMKLLCILRYYPTFRPEVTRKNTKIILRWPAAILPRFI